MEALEWNENSFNGLEDAQLLLAVQTVLQGDNSAFKTIVEQYSRQIYFLARRYGNNPEDAEEIVQEVFLKVFRSLVKFKISKRFQPWIYRIALNHIHSLHRHRNRKKRPTIVRLDDCMLKCIVDEHFAYPVEYLLKEEQLQLARTALSHLRPIHRKVFVLRVLEEMSVHDVAELLRIPEGTVKTYTFRAKKKIIDEIMNKMERTDDISPKY